MNDRGTGSSTPDFLLVVMLVCALTGALTSLVPTFVHRGNGQVWFGRIPCQTESNRVRCDGKDAPGFELADPTDPAPCASRDDAEMADASWSSENSSQHP
ncbi:hypothetical protein SAMN05421819_3997 [Bryocella elongata]|uniref:Uncharacterized protein n=1 Tax=Bryocella elongata TaxID=863522 RepID=A0A1H6BW54_9BACT|nr:hypothetical protein [Bryocella elongata]SEG64903.1 hypothetical protein SAMN05421819_3997 [Bryocella elongata]